MQRVTSLHVEGKMCERSQHRFRDHRRRKRWSYYRLVPGILFVTAMVGGVSFSLQDAGASNRTPGQVLAASKAAAASEASLHYVSTTKTPADAVTITGDVSKTEGEQTIVAKVDGQVGHVTVMSVSGSAFSKETSRDLPLSCGYRKRSQSSTPISGSRSVPATPSFRRWHLA
jgi:predicted phage tail protein